MLWSWAGKRCENFDEIGIKTRIFAFKDASEQADFHFFEKINSTEFIFWTFYMQNPTFLLLLCEKEQKTQFSKLEMSIQLSVFKNAKMNFLISRIKCLLWEVFFAKKFTLNLPSSTDKTQKHFFWFFEIPIVSWLKHRKKYKLLIKTFFFGKTCCFCKNTLTVSILKQWKGVFEHTNHYILRGFRIFRTVSSYILQGTLASQDVTSRDAR